MVGSGGLIFSYCQDPEKTNVQTLVGPSGGMVYTSDLKSAAERLTGSSPVLGTNKQDNKITGGVVVGGIEMEHVSG